MNRSEAASGLAWNTLLALAAKVILPIVGILIARFLGPTEMGIFATIGAVAAVVDIFRDAGLAQSFISERKPTEGGDRAYASLALATGLFFAAATFLFRGPLADALRMPELRWGLGVVSLTFVISSLSTIPFAKLQREARFKAASLLEIATMVVSYGVAAYLAFTGWGYQALVIQMLVRVVLLTGAAYAIAPVGFGRLSREFVLPIWRRSMTILLGSFVSSVYTIADNLLISRLFGAKSTGYYSTAFNVAMKPVELISWPLSRTMFVAYSRTQTDTDRLRHVFYKSITAAAFLTLPLYAFMLTHGREIILALYGTKYEPSGPLLSILAIYLAARSIGTQCGGLLVAIGRTNLGNMTWIAAYAIGGGGILLQWGSLTLESTVIWLTAGATTAYVLSPILAMRCVPPDAKNRTNLLRVGVVTLVLGAFCASTHLLPIGEFPRVIGTGALLPILGLALVGSIYEGSPLACLSRSGVRRVWDKL